MRTEAKPNSLVISLSGDINVGYGFNAFDNSWRVWTPEFLHQVRGTVWLANLETTITNENDESANKMFHFRSPPQIAANLLPLELTAVNIANNHILDCNSRGLIDTLSFL